jgi:hypothetical protein
VVNAVGAKFFRFHVFFRGLQGKSAGVYSA